MVGVGLIIGMALVSIAVGYAVRRKVRHAVVMAGQELLAATAAGDLDCMEILLKRRGALEARNAQGWTPLHVAAAGGDLAVVRLLLQHGADVNAQSYIGATPLDHSFTYGRRPDVVALLQSHGAQGHTSWDSIF